MYLEEEDLLIPKEPLDLKKMLRTLLETGEEEKYIVFAGNKLPKYLWDNLSGEIKKKGGSWQILLKALSKNYQIAIEWLEGRVSWEAFVKTILADITREKIEEKIEKPKSLLEFLE